MRRYAVAATLTIAILALAGCQSKEAKVESKQDQLSKLQDRLNIMRRVYYKDCPMSDMTNQAPTESPKCQQELSRINSVEHQVNSLAEQIAAQ